MVSGNDNLYVLADTSALVALLDKGDFHHAWAQARFRELKPPLHTCEAVLAESAFLLSRMERSRQALFQLWERGILKSAFAAEEERQPLLRLMRRYRNIPMSLADACLVRQSELHASCKIWTLDSDFRIYRRHGRQVIPVLSPEG